MAKKIPDVPNVWTGYDNRLSTGSGYALLRRADMSKYNQLNNILSCLSSYKEIALFADVQ